MLNHTLNQAVAKSVVADRHAAATRSAVAAAHPLPPPRVRVGAATAIARLARAIDAEAAKRQLA